MPIRRTWTQIRPRLPAGPARFWGAALLWCLLLAASPALAGGLVARGQVLGPAGRPVAGALVSDGRVVMATDQKGRFSLTTSPGRVVALCAPPGLRPAGNWWWPADQAARTPPRMRLEAMPPDSSGQVALLADPHLYSPECPPRGRRAGPQPLDLPMRVWKRLAGELRQRPPALTLVAGDLTADSDHHSPFDAACQLKLARRALELLPAPARALPGNHDVRPSGNGQDLSWWRRHLGPARQVFLTRWAAYVLLDSQSAPPPRAGGRHALICGRLSGETLDWLKVLLPLLPADLPLVLVSHHPLLLPDPGSHPLGPVLLAWLGKGKAWPDCTDQAQPLLELVAGRQVVLVSGHLHLGYEAMGRGSPLWGLPAICGGWWQGPRRLGPLSFPAGYVLLNWSKAGPRLTVKELSW